MIDPDSVALVGPEIEENLSLRYLASSLEQRGLRAELFPFDGPHDLPSIADALLAEEPPRLIAISLAFQWRALDALALAVTLRQRGYRGHITAGGHFGSLTWRELLCDFPELDSICRFEAEETLAELALALRHGRPLGEVAGLALPSGSTPILTELRQAPALATLPWPDRRGAHARCLGHGIATLVSSRGCYAQCSFCCISTLHREAQSPRHRLRPIDDVADEMAFLYHHQQREIFIFHDDNFFVPSREESLARAAALADALEARGVRHFATVVKARPNDVHPELFRLMRERLGLVRVFLGVESSTQRGTRTLARGVRRGAADEALALLGELGIYVCFNMLVFDPDATTDDLLANMDFIERHGSQPSNFGRVELYTGTPLLVRLRAERRVTGDYVQWDYQQASTEMQRVFELALDAFYQRNFAGPALANRLQSTRFDAEIATFFHPKRSDPAWLVEAQRLSSALAASSARAVREIVAWVHEHSSEDRDASFLRELSLRLRGEEAALEERAAALEATIQSTLRRRCHHAPDKGLPIPRPTPAALTSLTSTASNHRAQAQ